MTNDTATKRNADWDDLEARVLEPFDLTDVGVKYAVDRWRVELEKRRELQEMGKVTHAFSSPKVIDAVVNFFRADIAENQAIYKAKVARSKRVLAFMNIEVALGECDGFFADEDDGEHVVPERLAVLRVSKAARQKNLHRVVQASMQLARSNGDDEADEPSFPSVLGDIQEYAADLKDFIDGNGNEGREIIVRVCEDRGFAQKVSKDDDMPRCLRFLAQIVVETNTMNRLPATERRIGFASR